MILFLIFFFSMVLCYSKISNRDMKIVAPSILFFISIVSYFSSLSMSYCGDSSISVSGVSSCF